MKVIFGLGNPGNKYETTRHNVGFLFVDYLAHKFGFTPYKNESKFKALLSEGVLNGEKVLVVKPQTFMNLSGQTVQSILNFYKIPKENFIIVYDDKDMEFEKIRFRKTGSSGGHNGLKSIITTFGTEFKRIKIGVANDLIKKFDTADFVLNNFKKEEMEKLPFVFEEVIEMLNAKL